MRAFRGSLSVRPGPGSPTSEISVGTALTAGVSPLERRAAGRKPKAESRVAPRLWHPPIGDHSFDSPRRGRRSFRPRKRTSGRGSGGTGRFPQLEAANLKVESSVENGLELEEIDGPAVGVRGLSLGVVRPRGARQAQVGPRGRRSGARRPRG